MDDDFDDFLNSLSTPATIPTGTGSSTNVSDGSQVNYVAKESSNNDIDDEFLDLLGSPGVSSANPTTITSSSTGNMGNLETMMNNNQSSISPNKADHDDLLSWLEETPTKQPSLDHGITEHVAAVNLNQQDEFLASPTKATITVPESSNENHNISASTTSTVQTSSDAFLDLLSPQPTSISTSESDLIVSSATVDTTSSHLLGERIAGNSTFQIDGVDDSEQHSENHTDGTKTVDNFFNDVFGTKQNNVLNGFEEHTFKTLSEQIEEIVASPFPDIGKLRQLIDEEEHIPQSVRARVLLLLLTGSCLGDDEAQKFSATEADRRHYSHLVDDCETLVKSCGISNIQIAEQMKNIIILYCQRRSADYRNVFSRILLSVFGNRGAVPKSIASSCFYALSSNFLPMIGLQHTPLEHSLDKIHSWLRLLLIYQSPALAQHLDRVVPGWEKPSKEISTAQAARFSSIMKGSSNLDQLEKELGIDLEFEFESELNHDESEKIKQEKVVQSAPPKRAEGSGLIPSHWIMSFFSGCMPAEESAKLLDWSVFNGERFAGIYFIVSLLELNREYLLQQNAAKLTQWFEDVATNKTNWFTIGCLLPSNPMTWASFTRGWIHATAALLSGTPSAVRNAINQVEGWAIEKTDREAKDITSQLREYYANEKNLDDALDGKVENGDDEDDMFNEDDVDDEENDEQENRQGSESEGKDENSGESKSDAAASESSLLNTALGHLRTLSSKLQARDDSSVEDLLADLRNSSFVHDRKTSSNTMTLWSTANEVIPSICSNQRRAISLKGVLPSFEYAVTNYKEDYVGTCFFVTKFECEKPFYFAIDCRSSEEKLLGQFPKAYALDPEVVTDGDALTNLIMVLEPLRSSTHIAIIGPGDEYFKWFVKERAAKKFTRNSKKETIEINKMIREGENRVNAVAMFLIKKSFKFVSVLDGGFYEAVKFMNRNDSKNTISSSLVDVDKALLHSMLGIAPPPMVNTGASKSIIPASVWTETAPNAIKSVGNFISAWSSAAQAAAANQGSQAQQSTNTATSTSNEAAAVSVPSPAATSQEAKPILGGWGKFNLMSSIETIKKNISNAVPVAAVGAQDTTSTAAPRTAQAPSSGSHPSDSHGKNNFVIDEMEDDGMGPRDLPETNKISIVKTDSERAQALAIHRMAGLKKGDSITISRADLPGAVLFPCVKTKEVWIPAPEGIDGEATVVDGHNSNDAASDPHHGMVKQEQVVSRYLVVSRERFMVLDAHGGGVGSVATVKSNHHLTELIKMTFKKKDPELVTLHLYAADDKTKTRAYRVAKYKDFVTALQKHMERFK